MKQLTELKIPLKIRKLIEFRLDNRRAKVRFEGIMTQYFQISRGQTGRLPLFNLALKGIIRKANLVSKNIITNQIPEVAHGDDLTIIAST